MRNGSRFVARPVARPAARSASVALALCCAAGMAWGAAVTPTAPLPEPGVLNLAVGDVRVAGEVDLLAGEAFPAARVLLVLAGPVTPESRAALERAGATLGQYVPNDALFADVTRTSPALLRATGLLRAAVEWRAEWKLSPEIGLRQFESAERRAIADAGEVVVTLTLFPGERAADAAPMVTLTRGTRVLVTDTDGVSETLNVQLPLARVAELAALPMVQFVEETPEFTTRNNTTRWVVQTNVSTTGPTPLYNAGINGRGQVLGHVDDRIGVGHCAFNDPLVPITAAGTFPTHRKIAAYNATLGFGFHGAHTAATAAGDGGGWTDTRGVAWGARIAHNTIPTQNETGLFTRFSTHHNQGARVHTNSWGNDGTTSYDGACRGIDNFSWLNEDSVVAFAVTNSSTLKNPENAKNVLAVGATQDSPSQANHCSGGTGPTIDGRRKPEVYAPGCNTLSASTSTGCSVSGATGTSMACPAVSGAGLLIRQYFADGFYPTGAAVAGNGFSATGALVRAMITNSAQDMTGVAGYPSNLEGWGRARVEDVAFLAGDARRLIVRDVRRANGLSQGQSTTVRFRVNSPGQPLRVTLSFTDAPATAGVSNPVINNVDLRVAAPGGTPSYLGNVFTAGFSSTGGAPDLRNTTEQVHLSAPTAGVWTVTISAPTVITGPQGYALVITGDVSDMGDGACVPDFNSDGELTFDDIQAFVSAYNAQWTCADFNNDQEWTFDDIQLFVAAYNAGC